MNFLKITAATILLVPSVAVAQSPSGVDETARVVGKDELIVTANGFAQRREEVGQAITLITKADLERNQTVVISDILRTVPSVSIARNGGIGAVTSAFVRGGESSQTLVLIDGVRINDPSSPNAAFDFGALLTGNIARVEVLRGPNSVIWGSQAIGGVINIETVEPSDALTFSGRTEYGYRDTGQVQANIAGTSGNISASLGGGYFRTDGISALEAGTERDGYKNASANAKIRLRFTDGLSLDLRGYYNRGVIAFDDPFALRPDSGPETRNEQFIGYAGLKLNQRDGKIQSRLSYSRADITRTGSEPNVPLSFNVNRLQGVIDRVEFHNSVALLDAVTLVTGLEYERTSASIFFPAGGGAGPNRARTNVASGFGQMIVRPVKGLTLTSGVRHDDFSQFGGETTFGANFAYSPNAGATIFRGTYAEGFRAPTLTEALLPFGNPSLQPETARSFDAGIEQELLGGLASISATFFKRRSQNTITFSFLSFRSENIARVSAEGLELGLALRPNDALAITMNYSLVDAENRSPGRNFGNSLARRPKHAANMSADWKTPWGFSLGGGISIVGDGFDNLANTRRLDGYSLVGLRAAMPVTQEIEFFARVDNLFDEQYQTATGFGTFGRNAYVGVRARF